MYKQHCVQDPHKPFWSRNKTVKIHQIPAATDNLIWLIEYEPGLCAAVDGPSAQEVLDYCEQHTLRLTTIINTHTHGDHIGINRALDRLGLLPSIRVFGAAKRAADIPGLTDPCNDSDRIFLGETPIQVFLTEGHIDGHLSFLVDNILFCGDTMFTGGCGYLFDGPPQKMHHSLQRLAKLPPNTKVCCAHEYTEDNLRFAWSVEPDNHQLLQRIHFTLEQRQQGKSVVPSTMEIELATNPFLRVASPTIIKSLQKHQRATTDEATIFASLRQLKDAKHYRSEVWPPPK